MAQWVRPDVSGADRKNVENNPMHSSRWRADTPDFPVKSVM
jgi:hypothetical protein